MPNSIPVAGRVLVVDDQPANLRTLAALLSRDGREVLHAVWSDSPWLACAQHNGLACEVRLLSMPTEPQDPLASLSLIRSAPAGFHALIGPDPSDAETRSKGDSA